MALTKSFMPPLGIIAPPFRLPNVVSGEMQELDQLKGAKGTLIIFMCNHCPYVIHLLDDILKTAEKLLDKKIKTIAISSNSVVTHPQDGPDKMKELAVSKKFSFPYLYDKSQEVAKSYKAECTPDFYLFNEKLILDYRGRYDESRPGNQIKVTGNDLHNAVKLMISDSEQIKIQYPSMGCNIKWHP